ncbi:serine hydrolase domain-containing protein [Curtobacterium flaccumfaciens]|uniref:serine hydrolase domain-containing protein n=1 Tax=Curtobacterium flaccumfaciens TaxID=2035 RepID=UPI00160048BA|nr:serine hydrolase domain-containing protein [Curtobacterium flaccumfaciens]
MREEIDVFRAKNDVPGVSVCFFDEDGPLVAASSGFSSSRAGATVMTPETVFRIYSITKMMTGTAALQMTASGLLDLDRPISAYLPAAIVGPDASEITTRMLLSHRSGLGTDALTRHAQNRAPNGLSVAVEHDVPILERVASPGDVYSYSSMGISVLGLIMERISDLPFRELMRQLVIEPLSMGSTSYVPEEVAAVSHARHHLVDRAGRLRPGHDARLGTRYETSSRCWSTPSDVARFGAAHLSAARGNGPAGETLRSMHRIEADIGLDVATNYGLTCYRTDLEDGGTLLGHEGFFGGMWAKLVMDPRQNIGLVWMDNRGDEIRDARYAVMRRMCGMPGKPKKALGRSQATGAPPVGSWSRPGFGSLRIESEGPALGVTEGSRTVRLSMLGPDRWASISEERAVAAPWAPHATSTHVALGVVRGAEGLPRYVQLNGVPYSRTEGSTSAT